MLFAELRASFDKDILDEGIKRVLYTDAWRISGKVSLFGSSQVQLLEQEYGLKVQIMTQFVILQIRTK